MKTKGFTVILTREEDVCVSLNRRAEIANEEVCDLFVSIHNNSFIKKEAHGIETWFYPGADDAVVEGICNYCSINNDINKEETDYKEPYTELLEKNKKLKEKISKRKNLILS